MFTSMTKALLVSLAYVFETLPTNKQGVSCSRSRQGRQDEGLPGSRSELDGESASQWYQWYPCG
jgi:hypothetical protein